MKLGAWLGAFLLLLGACGPAQTTDYFVDNSCAESGNGRSARCGAQGPFRTIAEALRAGLRPGATIRVRATGAAYVEPGLKTTAAGSRSRPITLASHGESKAVWTGSRGVRLRVAHRGWVVEGFEFDGGGLASDLLKVDASDFTLRDCELHGVRGDGLSAGEDADRLTIDGCHFHHLGSEGDQHAIVTGKERGDARRYRLTGLKISGNTFDNIGGDGIQLYEASGACRKATVTGRIENNTFVMGRRPGHENAIDVKVRGRADDPLVIHGNAISGWGGSTTESGSKPVVLQHCSDYVHFTDNFVERGEGPGSCDPCFGLVVSASTASARSPVRGVRIAGNTFVGQKRAVQLGEGRESTGFTGIEILNNTAYGLSAAMFRIAGPLRGTIKNNLVVGEVLSCTDGGDLSGVVSSHNGWFGSAAQRRTCKDRCGGLCNPTDTTGQAPGFADPAANDFTLVVGSPAIDSGTPVGLPFNGAAPDLGAAESAGR